MGEDQPERRGGSASAQSRTEWTAPQVDRLIAGGAEGSAGADVEGLDGLS
ncbi:MAG TPA: hypothetical protein VF652_09225 [Allosphingosinicella sp.]|jgi:hypothetical protein